VDVVPFGCLSEIMEEICIGLKSGVVMRLDTWLLELAYMELFQ
jgi:hypothetical protein